MLVLNNMDRFHLVMDVIDRVPGLSRTAAWLRQEMVDIRTRHWAWTREHGEDLPEVRDWAWTTETAKEPQQRAGAGTQVRAVPLPPGRWPAARRPASWSSTPGRAASSCARSTRRTR